MGAGGKVDIIFYLNESFCNNIYNFYTNNLRSA